MCAQLPAHLGQLSFTLSAIEIEDNGDHDKRMVRTGNRVTCRRTLLTFPNVLSFSLCLILPGISLAVICRACFLQAR